MPAHAPLALRRERGAHATLGAAETVDLASLDIVLMRQDPPFDMAYITATHLLERIHPGTLVVNDPEAVRNAPEKLFVTRFVDIMPPTLITRSGEESGRFAASMATSSSSRSTATAAPAWSTSPPTATISTP